MINNWEKVFCATEAYNTHGRRWKFRIQPLKESIKEGNFNFNADVVLQKAKDSENGDVDAILERYSRDTRSQVIYILISHHLEYTKIMSKTYTTRLKQCNYKSILVYVI